MNNLDVILQKQLPTVMVPRYEELAPCGLYKSRFLMGAGGLFVETRQPYGVFRGCLWSSPRKLPYGAVEERDDLTPILRNETVQTIIRGVVVPEASVYAATNREWAGWIVWNAGAGYEYMPLDFEARTGRVRFARPDLPEGTSLAVDIHSHGKIAPFFSWIDDRDDAGGVRLCVVIGGYTPESRFSFRSRVIVEGHFFDHMEEEQ
jgi:PRTRC genetic system protein A